MATDPADSTSGLGPTERDQTISATNEARTRAERAEATALLVQRQLQQVLEQRTVSENTAEAAAEASRHQADAVREQQRAEMAELRVQVSAMAAGGSASSRAASPGAGTTYGTGPHPPPVERWGIVDTKLLANPQSFRGGEGQ